MVDIIILIISSLFLFYAFSHAKEICSTAKSLIPVFIIEVGIYIFLFLSAMGRLFA